MVFFQDGGSRWAGLPCIGAPSGCGILSLLMGLDVNAVDTMKSDNVPKGVICPESETKQVGAE